MFARLACECLPAVQDLLAQGLSSEKRADSGVQGAGGGLPCDVHPLTFAPSLIRLTSAGTAASGLANYARSCSARRGARRGRRLRMHAAGQAPTAAGARP
eukprot:8776561-Pyramimonas_sp.AAC.1